jgi:hypothetical protein
MSGRFRVLSLQAEKQLGIIFLSAFSRDLFIHDFVNERKKS